MATLRAGLVGAHISQTRLPAALQIMCDRIGWDFEFELIDSAETEDFDFEATVDLARQDGWSGITVTHPFKADARQYAGDGMSGDVAHLGACNTLVFGDPVIGYNTDYTGFLAAMEAAQLGKIGETVMIGAGGVARAIGPALTTMGASLGLYDQNLEQAQNLAQMIGPSARVLAQSELGNAIKSADGLVNATPMGMAEYPGSAFDPAQITGRQRWAFDAVYTPTDTVFLNDASAAGLQCISGFDLFLAMAVRSFQAYTNETVAFDEVLPELVSLRPE